MSKTEYEFSVMMQIKIVAMMLYDRPTFIYSMDVVIPEYFENPILQGMIKVIYSFYDRYAKVPDHEEFLEECVKYFGKTRISDKEWVEIFEVILEIGESEEAEQFDYVKDQVVSFARYQAVKQAILLSAEELSKSRNYEKILADVERAVLIGESSDDLGVDYFKDTMDRLGRRREGNTRLLNAISTGIPGLDAALCGGLGGTELGILMSPMKRGKSTTMISFGVGALRTGKNVLHIVFESDEDRTMDLYDACVSGIPKNELLDRENAVKISIDDFLEQRHVGKLRIKDGSANAWSTRNIEALMQKLRMIENFEPDLLIIDYLGLMRSADKSLKIEASSGGKYFLLGAITKELLNLKDKYKCGIWVVHQSTRGSKSKKTNIDLDDSGDSIEPMRDADLIITLNQTPNEADPEISPGEQKMRFFTAGGRSIPDRKTIHTIIDKSTCRIRDDVAVVKAEDTTGLNLSNDEK